MDPSALSPIIIDALDDDTNTLVVTIHLVELITGNIRIDPCIYQSSNDAPHFVPSGVSESPSRHLVFCSKLAGGFSTANSMGPLCSQVMN
jgi:hypothetical protein